MQVCRCVTVVLSAQAMSLCQIVYHVHLSQELEGCQSSKPEHEPTDFSELKFTKHQPGKVSRQKERSAEKLNVLIKVPALKKRCTIRAL